MSTPLIFVEPVVAGDKIPLPVHLQQAQRRLFLKPEGEELPDDPWWRLLARVHVNPPSPAQVRITDPRDAQPAPAEQATAEVLNASPEKDGDL